MDTGEDEPQLPPLGNEFASSSIVPDIERFTTPVPSERVPATGDRAGSSPVASLPFVLMDEGNRTEIGFATLDKACERAASGGLIELRFDGKLPMRQPPVRIQHKRLTIRAQTGRRPVIEFEPRASTGQTDAGVIQIVAGELELQNVELQMTVPAGASDDWSLFSLVQAERFAMDGVSIVISNPDRRPASVVTLVPPPGLDSEDMMPESMRHELVELDWRDCLIRGECDLLTATTLDPTDLHCENVAMALRGAFLRVRGRVSADGIFGNDRKLSLVLQHVTALLNDGLIRVDTGYEIDREFLPIEVQTHDTALVVRTRQPLAAMTANQDLDTLKRRLRWQSSWSAFDVTGPVWEITQTLEGKKQQLDFASLAVNQQVIENDLLQQPVDWSNARFTALTESAFRLRPAAAQSTRNSRTGVEFGERFPASDSVAASAGTLGGGTRP
jgi:hypothetical protein